MEFIYQSMIFQLMFFVVTYEWQYMRMLVASEAVARTWESENVLWFYLFEQFYGNKVAVVTKLTMQLKCYATAGRF